VLPIKALEQMQLALVELNHYKKMYAELAYKLYQSESL
jgi:hypothetical protein